MISVKWSSMNFATVVYMIQLGGQIIVRLIWAAINGPVTPYSIQGEKVMARFRPSDLDSHTMQRIYIGLFFSSTPWVYAVSPVWSLSWFRLHGPSCETNLLSLFRSYIRWAIAWYARLLLRDLETLIVRTWFKLASSTSCGINPSSLSLLRTLKSTVSHYGRRSREDIHTRPFERLGYCEVHPFGSQNVVLSTFGIALHADRGSTLKWLLKEFNVTHGIDLLFLPFAFLMERFQPLIVITFFKHFQLPP